MGFVTVDKEKVLLRIEEQGITRSMLYKNLDISEPTIDKMLNPESTSQNQVSPVKKLIHFIHPSANYMSYVIGHESAETNLLGSWKTERSIGHGAAANGLIYKIYEAHHRRVPERAGRLKQYILDDLSTEHSSHASHYLTRHSQACDRLQPHSMFPINYEVTKLSDVYQFLVVDHWPSGDTVQQIVQNDIIESRRLAQLMLSVAEAIEHAHANDVIIRHLSPDRIYLDDSGAIQVTDLEMTKILDSNVTVRNGDMVIDPYVAPEVGGPTVSVKADFFSWAQLFIYAGTGRSPTANGDTDAILAMKIPKALCASAAKCLSVDPRLRPENLKECKSALKEWLKVI